MPRKILLSSSDSRLQIVRWAARATDLSGTFCVCPQKITRDAVTKAFKYCEYFVKQGQFPQNKEKFTHVKGELYKLKPWGWRIFGYFEDDGKTFVIVNCVEKKGQKSSKKVLAAEEASLERIELAKKDVEYIE